MAEALRTTPINKISYLLTQTGIEQKASVTIRFLRSKLAEYEKLEKEIEQLRCEVGPEIADAVYDAFLIK